MNAQEEGAESPDANSGSDPSMDQDMNQAIEVVSDAEGSDEIMTPLPAAGDDEEGEEEEEEEEEEEGVEMLEDFPLSDFMTVAEGLTRSPNWTVYPSQLANCLAAAVRAESTVAVPAESRCDHLDAHVRGRFPFPTAKMCACLVRTHQLQTSDTARRFRLRSSSTELRQLYRELVPSSFEKCVDSTDLWRWNAGIQANILEACAKLAELVAIKLSHTVMTEEAEEDMLRMLHAMTCVFDKDAEFHRKHIHSRLPRGIESLKEEERFAAPLYATPVHVRQRGGDADNVADTSVIAIDEDEDKVDPDTTLTRGRNHQRAPATDDVDVEVQAYHWLQYLINYFGVTGGFDAVLHILHDPSRVSLKLLDATMKVAAKCILALDEHLLQRFEEHAQIALKHLADIVVRGDEQLMGLNPGVRDQRYLHLTSTLRSMQVVLGACVGVAEAEKRVSKVNREVVEGILGISTFNMQLVALREINVMLDHASSSRLLGDVASAVAMKTAVRWLESKGVLAHALRPVYLHHKQYVDQVAQVLRTMLQEGAMQEEHLDLLWDITQKQDTFEEVKNNVLDLLAALAWHFSGEQLDSLFSRFERAGSGGMSLTESGKILEMVQKLARSDSQGVMAKRLLELLWRMIHAREGAASSTEIVAAFTKILAHYDRMKWAQKEEWMARTLDNVRNRTADLAILLILMQSIVTLDSDMTPTTGGNVAEAGLEGGAEEERGPYEGGKGKGLKKKRRGEPRAVAAAQENAAVRRDWLRRLNQSDNLVELLVTSLEHVQATAWADNGSSPRPVADAVTGYRDTLRALMKVIHFVLKNGEIEVGPKMALRLWAAFVESPGDAFYPEAEPGQKPERYRDLGLLWMAKLMVVPPCSLSEETVLHLLRSRLVKESAQEMTSRGWHLFRAFFLQAALDAGKLMTHDVDSDANDGEQQSQYLRVEAGAEERLPRQLITDVPNQSLSVKSADLTGVEQLWCIALDSDGGFVDEAVHLLIHLHTNLTDDFQEQITALHGEFLGSLLRRMEEAAATLGAGGDAEATVLAEQRAERCMLITQHFIIKCEGTAEVTGAPVPHGGSFPGIPITLEIIPSMLPKQPHIRLLSNSNAMVRSVREAVARELHIQAKRVRMVCRGRELLQDNRLMREVVQDLLDIGNNVVLQVMVSPEVAAPRTTAGGALPAKLLPRSLLARQPGAYDVLFQLAELPGSDICDAGEGAVVRKSKAQELLLMLPTRQDVCAELCTLLAGSNVAAGVEAIVPAAEDPSRSAAAARARLRELLTRSPARLVYTLQVLDGLLSSGFNGEDNDASVRFLQVSFAALGCARDILAVLPRSASDAEVGGVDGHDEGLSAVAAAGAAAWREPSLRRALCTSVLNLLKVILSDPQGSPADTAPEGSLGSLGGAIGGMGICTPKNDALQARLEDDDSATVGTPPPPESNDTTARAAAAACAALATEAVPTLSRLAYAMGTGRWEDLEGASVSDPDPGPVSIEQDGIGVESALPAENIVSRDDVHLAIDATELLVTCLQRAAQSDGSPTRPLRHAAELLLDQPLFPRMLRDMVIRSPLQMLRMNTVIALLRLIENQPAQQAEAGAARTVSFPNGMMATLLEARAEADRNPSQCREFFLLLCHMLKEGHGEGEGGDDSGSGGVSDDVVDELLAKEVDALRVTPPATDEDAVHLESRLKLIKCLIERLDYRAVGSKVAGLGLVQVLFFRCLFPEAVPVLQPSAEVLRLAGMPPPVIRGESGGTSRSDDSGESMVRRRSIAEGNDEEEKDNDDDEEDDDVTIVGDIGGARGGRSGTGSGGFSICNPDVEMLDEHLLAVCSNSATRHAAFQLLADLASRDTENMLEVTETLMNLHYRGGVDINEWEQLPSGMPRVPGGYVGLKNAGATCYMNAVFQQLYMQPELRNAVLSVTSTAKTKEEQKESVFYQFQLMFASLAASHMDHYAPQGFWRAFKDYDGEPINVREHQDGLEFFSRLQDMVDTEYKKAVAAEAESVAGAEESAASGTPLVKGAMEAVMGGQFVNQVLCRNCPAHRSEREEDFVHVSVDVRNKRDLVESLTSYVSGELLEADNQWYCEQCGCKVDAVKRACFKRLPHTLCVHLKRFEFDYETMQRLKVKGRFEFPMELDMTPFTAEGIERDAAAVERVAGEGARSVDTPELENPPEHYHYRLVGVVVHSGTAFAGHYYSFIREREAPPGAAPSGAGDESRIGNRWHVFDDQRVDPYDISSLEADTFGGKYTVNMANLVGGNNEDEDVQIGGGGGRVTDHDRPNSAYMLFYERVKAVDEVVAPPSRSATPTMGAPAAVQAKASKDVTPASPAVVPLPALPQTVRSEVMTQNLQFVFNGNLFSREYFAFIQRMVESTLVGIARKAQRRGVESGRSRGIGARGARAAGSVDGGNGPSQAQWRTPEEEEEHAVLSIRIATEFLCHVYLRAHQSMRDRESLLAWRSTVMMLLDRFPVASRWFLDFLGHRPQYLSAFLLRCPSPDAREIFASFVASALRSTVGNDDGGASAEAALASITNSERGGGAGVGGSGAGYPGSPLGVAPTGGNGERRQVPRAARLVDGVLQNLVRVLNENMANPNKLVSPSLYFYVLQEYASLGPGQRVQLLQYGMLQKLMEFINRMYHMPTPRLYASSREMHPCYQLLASLLCSCDLTEVRHYFTNHCVRQAAEAIQQPIGSWYVGDLQEDETEQYAMTGGPSPVAQEGSFCMNAHWGTRLVERLFLQVLTDLATESSAALAVVLHICWRWEWVSRFVLNEILEHIETQDPMDILPVLDAAEKLLMLKDWCSEIRASCFLEGRNAHDPVPIHIMVLNNDNPPIGLIELAGEPKFSYPKRYLVLRFLVKSVVNDVLPHLRHIIQMQGDDFALALDALEDDVHRFGPMPIPAPGGDGSDTTPTSGRQNPTDHPEWIINQGRVLCQ